MSEVFYQELVFEFSVDQAFQRIVSNSCDVCHQPASIFFVLKMSGKEVEKKKISREIIYKPVVLPN